MIDTTNDEDTLRTRAFLPGQPWSQTRQVAKKSERVFMIFAPWGDQGLGIQAREYAKFLTALSWRVVVYSHFPAKGVKKTEPPAVATKSVLLQRLSSGTPDTACRPLQASVDEWCLPKVKVVYSKNTRENTDVSHMIQIIRAEGVTDIMLLELQYAFMFRLACRLAAVNVRVYAVPNIELVRKSEVLAFNGPMFFRVLCNNIYTYHTLVRHGVHLSKLAHFPFFLMDRPTMPARLPTTTVKFLLIGGMNAFSRKQAGTIIDAFAAVTRRIGRETLASLTITVQDCETVPPAALKAARALSNIAIVRGHQTHDQIRSLYRTHHIVLFCSRAEGIGIGLHEAMQHGCAVLALGTPINREIMVRGMTGWTLAATPQHNMGRLIGNDQMIVPCYSLHPIELQLMIFNLATSPADVIAAMYTAPVFYHNYQRLAAVLQRWALHIQDPGLLSDDNVTTNVLRPPSLLV